MQQLADALQALLCCFSCCPASQGGDERPARKAHDDVPPAVDSESAKYLSDNVAYVDSEAPSPGPPGLAPQPLIDQRTAP